MALTRTLSLLLAAVAVPALAQTPAKPTTTAAPPAAGAPIATKPAAAATAQPAAAPITNSPGATPKADDWPRGAPQTDYEFTAWCYGVLRTHMELYEKVKPELLAISKRWKTEEEDEKSYSDQIAAGKTYLTQFAHAIELTEKASARPIQPQGAAAITQGRGMWKDFESADKSTQAYSWMNWELPEKCPKVAKALENRSLLASPALKANTAAPKAAETKPADKPVAAAAPKAADPIGQLVTDSVKKDAPTLKPVETGLIATKPATTTVAVQTANAAVTVKKEEPPAKPAESKTAEAKPAPTAPPPAPAVTAPRLRPGRF